jgi:[ribosomal protein S5]-alanine N-acetyltransferase
MKSPALDPRSCLTSRRLRAEPVEKRHAAAMALVLDDPRIYRFLPDDPPSLEHLERHYEYLSGGKSPDGREAWLTWILMPHEREAAPIGFIQATVREPETAHIAYLLNPAHWRRGYGREAVTALLDFLFERYQVALAIAELDTRNEASRGLVEALGFHYARTVCDAAEVKGTTSHEYVYELTPAQWRARAAESRGSKAILAGFDEAT